MTLNICLKKEIKELGPDCHTHLKAKIIVNYPVNCASINCTLAVIDFATKMHACTTSTAAGTLRLLDFTLLQLLAQGDDAAVAINPAACLECHIIFTAALTQWPFGSDSSILFFLQRFFQTSHGGVQLASTRRQTARALPQALH